MQLCGNNGEINLLYTFTTETRSTEILTFIPLYFSLSTYHSLHYYFLSYTLSCLLFRVSCIFTRSSMKSFCTVFQFPADSLPSGIITTSAPLLFPFSSARCLSLLRNRFLFTAFPLFADNENPRRRIPREFSLYTALKEIPLKVFPVLRILLNWYPFFRVFFISVCIRVSNFFYPCISLN